MSGERKNPWLELHFPKSKFELDKKMGKGGEGPAFPRQYIRKYNTTIYIPYIYILKKQNSLFHGRWDKASEEKPYKTKMERENRKRRIICAGVFEGLESQTRDRYHSRKQWRSCPQKKKKNRESAWLDGRLVAGSDPDGPFGESGSFESSDSRALPLDSHKQAERDPCKPAAGTRVRK